MPDTQLPVRAPSTRDARLDVFRGLCLVMIFINHVPGNPYERFTSRNFGFSDAAEGFVMMSGIAAGLAYSMDFRLPGRLWTGLARMWKRAWTLYLVHLTCTAIALGAVAAVALATDINARVHDGLVAHVTAERARAQAAVSARALARIEDFARIMDERVAGGLSDRSEAQVIAQKRAEFAAMLASDRQAEAVAAADLAALSGGAASSVRGIDRLAVGTATARPLSVEKAEAEGARAVAEAQMERADLLPGLSAGVNVGTDGIDPGIRLGGGLLGMGTKAEVAALEATGDAMARRSAEAAETAERRIVALQGQIGVLQGREAQGAAVLAETESNLALFAEQYKVGRRSLLELAGQYDSFARLERDQAAIRHEIALIELEIARDRGLLVDGARM